MFEPLSEANKRSSFYVFESLPNPLPRYVAECARCRATIQECQTRKIPPKFTFRAFFTPCLLSTLLLHEFQRRPKVSFLRFFNLLTISWFFSIYVAFWSLFTAQIDLKLRLSGCLCEDYWTRQSMAFNLIWNIRVNFRYSGKMNFRHKCTSLSRYLIIILNAGIAVLALAIIGLVLWVRFDANFERSLRVDLQNTNPNPPDLWEVKNQIRTAVSWSCWVKFWMQAFR
jgi:hypothetical protein